MTQPQSERTRWYRLAIFIIAMVLVAVVGVLLTQFKPPLPEKNMQSSQDAHDAVRDAMASTIELFGGPEGWDPYFNASPDRCTVAGQEGINFTELRIGPGVASVEERDQAVIRVREHLESLGMSTWVGERTDADPTIRVLAEGGPTQGFSVYISVDQIGILGESWCVRDDTER